MLKTLFQTFAGTAGFVGASVTDSLHSVSEAVAKIENSDTYIKGLVISGLIQIALKIVDKWSERRKQRKIEKAA